MSYTIEVKGLDQLERKLSIPLSVVLGPAWLAIGHQLKSIIAVYPGPVSYPIRWQSEKQRRYFFAMRGGDLPYVRNSDAMSERLGPSWAVEAQAFGVIVGTRASYAPYVQGEETQQGMHEATGWITDKEAAEQLVASNVIPRIIEAAIGAAYN